MGSLKNISLRWKLLTPLGVVALTLIALAVTAITTTNQIGRDTQAIAERYLPSLDYLLQADRDLYQALVAERSMMFVSTNSPQFPKLIESHAENIGQASARVGKFFALNPDPEIQQEATKYQALRSRWEQLTDEVVTKRRNDGGDFSAAAIELSFGEARSVFSDMRDILDGLTEVTQKKAEAARESANASVAAGRTQTIFAVVIGLALCLMIAVALPFLILRPMKQLIAHVRDIAEGDGDLTVRLQVKSRDELGQLAEAFNRFIEKLHGTVQSIVGSTGELGGASEHLSQVAAESRDTVDRQLREIEQVAAAMNQMTATVQEVSRNASAAAQGAGDADKAAASGKRVVSETMTSIRDLAVEVENAGRVINELQEDSANIGTVLSVIQGVAEQTNLLALNAAIEAARAGEQGRGFAVVADEVRTLASRTQDSTQEIQTMIESLQARAARAVEVMEHGRSKAESSVEQARSAGESLEHIAQAVATINDMNAQIASAAEEQSAVAEDINRNTVTIRDLADQAANGGQETSAAAEQMNRLATELQQRVHHFKV